MLWRVHSLVWSLAMGAATLPLCALANSSALQKSPLTEEQSSNSCQVSARISACIIAGLPKYDESAIKDAAIVGRPPGNNDEVVLLPKLFVFASGLPTFSERDHYSKNDFAALLRARYPGASTRGQDPDRIDGRVRNYAAFMYAEDKRLNRIKDLTDFSDALRRNGDISGSDELRTEIQKAFFRHKDGLTEAIDRSVNNGRR
jgi:hypothetical protein